MLESMEEKEREAESKFKEWLDKHNIAYWYIQQDIDTFSPSLKHYMTRRPDFMILLPNFGFILTDVEYNSPLEKYKVFPIDKEETKQYVNLQKYFNFQVWYVFSHKNVHFSTWYWIPAQKVLDIGKEYSKKGDNREYFAVPVDETIQLSSNEDIGVLFSKSSFLLKVD